MSTQRDLLGRPLTAAEAQLLAAYEALKALAAEDLPPNAAANVREALAALWQAVHGLMLTEERCDA